MPSLAAAIAVLSLFFPAWANEPKLLDIAILGSADGSLHGVHCATGHKLWTTHLPGSDTNTTETAPSDAYIVEPHSGDILVLDGQGKRERLAYSVPELVTMSPFADSTAESHRVFVGKKTTAVVLVDLKTGKVRADSDCPLDAFATLKGAEAHNEVVLGRTDYELTIHSYGSKIAHNLRFSTYAPNTPQHIRVSRCANGQTQFSSPIVAVFDVLEDAAANTFALLKPEDPKVDPLASAAPRTITPEARKRRRKQRSSSRGLVRRPFDPSSFVGMHPVLR
ncbi:Serine/threonine-protein kinase ppk4 [Mycena kentingensis (nom. inval.)]|nr:Serine/threonine-protein kinase ppk4 [Mycena kentingensis (nom. inval.)]